MLDIGTGTGIWAIDFATAFPSADVLGIDLSPIQPTFVPPNCHFEVDDAEDEWIFSQKFDYIHGRMLGSCFGSHIKVFESAFNFLRPGGWFEMQDFASPFRCVDDTMKGTAFERWLSSIQAGCEKLAKDLGRALKYRQYMRDIGFVDIQQKLVAWPIGSWPKDEKMKTLDAWCKEDVLSGLQGTNGNFDKRVRYERRRGGDIFDGDKAGYQFEKAALLYPDVSFIHMSWYIC